VTRFPFQTAREIRDAVLARQISAVEVCEQALARIEAGNRRLNAFLTVAGEQALDRARAIDNGQHRGPLAGVPVAIKDNLMTRGIRTTAASRMLEKFVPPYDASVVRRLHSAAR
jgi:aspartyl-tRNA(Asn)/glutamyl-tRNA(Gln) amidotransferase subunit A